MKYYLFKLKFFTPVHFGDVAEGGNLARVNLNYGADRLFSALVQEAVATGMEVEKLLERFANGEMTLSSLWPWYDGQETELFLPKPFVQSNVRPPKAKSFSELKKAATEMKKLKKLMVIRASEMESFVRSVQHGVHNVPTRREFAEEITMVRVNKRGQKSLPYYVGSYGFAKQAGLYFVLGLQDESYLPTVCELVKMLGLTGIGGKRSSGYGKFELSGEVLELGKSGISDAVCLDKMLSDDGARIQMNLSPVCPIAGQDEIIGNGYYKLRKISGFADLPTEENVRKKDSFYVLAEGSCFGKRLQGEMKILQIPGLNHGIYRYCKGVFVGVKADE